MLGGITLFAWAVFGVFLLLCVGVIWMASQPGQRRRKQDKRYKGPDRRTDHTVTDFLAQPIFARPSTTVRDKITVTTDEEVDIHISLAERKDCAKEGKITSVSKSSDHRK